MNFFTVIGRRAIQLLGASIGLLTMCVSLAAQINTGRIVGTVTDQSGGVIAGATVVVTNSQTGVSRNLIADAAGEYAAPNLNPGTYTVRVTAPGFQGFERQNINLEVGKDARIDAQLIPGQISQTIQVTESVPLLDMTSATVTGTLNTEAIVDIPLNGRNYQNLLQLRPGVTTKPGGGTLTTSTNGLRPEDNNYYVEGLDNDEPFTGQSITNSTLPSGDAATILPIDAIQEVSIQTNSPAEFGKRPGAVINIGIKAGTNSIHGSAYAFGRDDALDSKEYSFAPSIKPPAQMEQWGGTAGGAIVKDKLFYFVGFERQTYTVGAIWPITAPSTSTTFADVSQDIPAATADLTAKCAATPGLTGTNGVAICGPGGTFTVNPLTAKIIGLFGTNSTNSDQQAYGFPDVVSIYNVVGKIDYHLSDHHTFSGSYFFGNGSSSSEDTAITQPFFVSLGKLRAQFVTTSWTWTPKSTWVNDLRLGANFHHRVVVPADSTTALNSYGLVTGVTNPVLGGFTTIMVSPFSQMGGDNNEPKAYGPSTDYDLVDHVSYLHGKHAFKFGAEILYERPFFGNFSGGRGQINFTAGGQAFPGSSSLEDFLAGVPDSSAGGNILNGSPRRQLKQWDYSSFFEDSWHIKPTVTLNLGLRYEYFTPLADSSNRIGNWDPQVGLEQVGVNIKSAYNPYHKDFSPRVGVAWDLGGKGKTVLRAGGGIYYVDLVVGAMVDNISLPGKPSGITSIPTAYKTGANGTAAPLNPITSGGIGTSSLSFSGSQLSWTLAGPVFPTSQIGGSAGFQCGDGLGTDPAPCNVLAMDKNLVPPRVETWTAGIQRTLNSHLTLEMNYIGDRSSNLVGIRDVNAIDPTNPLENGVGAGSCASTKLHCESITHRPYYAQFPFLQYINYMTNLDRSNYHALQTTLTERAFHGLGFVAAYTFGHGLDNSSANRNQQVPMSNLNPGLDYGNSDFDQRHHFALTLTYDLPGKKGFGQMLEGWKISSAVLLQSGLPWNPTAGNLDLSKTGDKKSDRWDFFGNPSDFTASRAPLTFVPGNIKVSGVKVINPALPGVCTQQATAIGTFNSATPNAGNLFSFGCFVEGNSVLIAPPTGTFGTAGRNIFRDQGFRDWDFSVFKDWTIKERLTAQFRTEIFNILNHTILANPGAGSISGGNIGCGCFTPDNGGQNPLLGTGGSRSIQFGLKLLF
jgi:hypothetical protein